jgi:hypothetical protein
MAPRTFRDGPALDEVIVIGLAAARVTRAIAIDDISEPLRDRLQRAAREATGSSQRALQLLADLVCCPVCLGWWTSLALSTIWPGRNRLRRAMSVAGAQVLITLAERLVSEQGRLAVREVEEGPAEVRVLGNARTGEPLLVGPTI